jgi:peroxiredoxin
VKPAGGRSGISDLKTLIRLGEHNMRFRTLVGSTLLALAFVSALHSQADAKGIGRKLDNVRLRGLDGSATSLHDLKEKQAVVVIFLSFDCPVCTSYVVRLTDLAKTYRDKGVAFLGICPGSDEAAELARQVKEFQPGFPVYRDDQLTAADAFRAVTTPEAFVLDAGFVVRYRGRIDDGYTARLKPKKEVGRHDLVLALDELLVGKPVSEPVTTAVGCPIPRPQSKTVTTKVTFYRDVLPVLQKRCQGCHRPNELGPFSLMTYKQAVNWAADIKEYTQSRKMPPWKPSEGAAFHGERKMTDQELATLAAWADGGTPEGDPKDAPPPAKFTDGWVLGQPDLILSPKEEMTVGASGRDLFRCFVLPTELDEDKFVIAYEVKPGNRRVVHHTLHFVDTKGRGRQLEKRGQERMKADDKDTGPGYTMMMGPGFFPPDGDVGGWAPGVSPHRFPADVGFYLPKGSDIVVQVHYHRTGKIEKDKSQLGLYFGKQPKGKPVQGMVIPGLFLSIPAGDEDYRVRGSIWAAQECTLHTVTPHMHLLGKKIKITMTPPGGAASTLVGIDQWDYNWQETYYFKEPIRVPAETRFDVEAVYDNSAKNPNNPFSPPRRVRFGEQTTHEMCFGFLGATVDKPGAIGFRLSANSAPSTDRR